MATWTGQQQEERMGRQQFGAAVTANQQSAFALKQAKEAWELKKKQSEQAGKLAGEFLQAWSGSMADVKGMYKSAFSALSGLSARIGGTSAQVGEMNETAKMIQEEYATFRRDYGAAEGEFMEGAREEAGIRRGAAQSLMDLSKPDYEGEMGSAAADVRGQSEIARQSQARALMGMGIDPSSGRFGAMSRKSFLDEAKNTAIAMNVARRSEKDRVGGLAMGAMQVLDPAKSGQMALGIRGQGTKMLESVAGIQKSAADVEAAKIKGISDIARTTGELTSGYSQAVTKPYSEFAGYYMGQAGANLPTGIMPR